MVRLPPPSPVVRIAPHAHGAVGVARAPPVCPEIQDVRRVQLAQQRREPRPWHHAPLWLGPDPFLPHPSLKLFGEQAEEVPVSSPVFQKAEEPRVAHALEARGQRCSRGERAALQIA